MGFLDGWAGCAGAWPQVLLGVSDRQRRAAQILTPGLGRFRTHFLRDLEDTLGEVMEAIEDN